MKGTFNAWAIDTGEDSFIGRYWWFEGRPPVYRPSTIPDHLEGCRVALFKTRSIARLHLPSVRAAYPQARVVQVGVRVIEQ